MITDTTPARLTAYYRLQWQKDDGDWITSQLLKRCTSDKQAKSLLAAAEARSPHHVWRLVKVTPVCPHCGKGST